MYVRVCVYLTLDSACDSDDHEKSPSVGSFFSEETTPIGADEGMTMKRTCACWPFSFRLQ